MDGRTHRMVFVDRETLRQVEQELVQLVRAGIASSVALIDRSGAVLSAVGDFPHSPEDMGATAAGIFSAMCAMVPPCNSHEFVVEVLTDRIAVRFLEIDERVFLCAFCRATPATGELQSALHRVASAARRLLAVTPGRKPSAKTLHELSEKLDELFSGKTNEQLTR